MDNEITLGELRADVRKFVADRCWEQYHIPKNLAMSMAIEAAEILEHFSAWRLERQWRTPEECERLLQDPEARAEVADEMADVLIYCLSFANQTGIDLSAAIKAKLARNEQRFPTKSTT